MTAALIDRTAVRQPAGRAARRPSRPRLQVLDQAAARRRSRHRMALLILFITVLAGFFAVAYVHAELVAGQNDLDTVRSAIKEAEARHAELARSVEEASAPAVIVTRATELGMVRANEPVYLTAAAPVRDIQVQPALATLIASEGPESGQAATIEVAGPTGDSAPGATPGADRALRGSLGMAGGISAAVRLPETPTLALGATAGSSTPDGATPAGPTPATPPPGQGSGSVLAGASTGPATATPAADPARAGVTAVSAGATVTVAPNPASSIAGTRAVSATAGAAASTSTSGLATAAAATGAG